MSREIHEIDGGVSIAMFDYQRVYPNGIRHPKFAGFSGNVWRIG
jgi:hypothetical protein